MKHFGLIGFPLGHSFSKKFFTEKFKQENIDAQYDLYELTNLLEFENLLTETELYGLNVTIPYKEKVIQYLDELDETAAEIGAVNVIKFIRGDGNLKLKGYNSDAIGFENSLAPLLKPYHQKALILGTGGASKAIDYTLRKLGIITTFVSRTAKPGSLTYDQLNEDILNENLVIINASPVGTFPHADECPNIPYQFLTDKHLLFDAVYNPTETLFLKKGKEQKAQTLNGEGMLTGQAIAAWKIWNE
ncbi:shikimate dehydrogenase [Paludibacter propionicigenes WB4]|uniref:Shikimate dehydrogenase n=1 Tax=Paludibacter propionicigenes (strain DSM 17365 / JCM 13257 / WB4) TaxID=694427 RepID=E4T886_PALPW|nr:shikimate dehydrogenase [Paludibacter propionicigenes]ADQ80930.1 shikimate dehydrogenase [Paludibacter propionicigenes WB4]